MADVADAAADAGARLGAVGTMQERFALMLHDRVVDLERAMSALAPRALDPAVTLLGGRARADTGAVFVRVRGGIDAETDAVAARVLGALGGVDDTRWDAWCCQHWSCLLPHEPYVLEMLVQRSGAGGVDVARVAHAALDAVRGLLEPRLARAVSVEACAVRSAAWFVESIRAAGLAMGEDTLYTWDPRARETVCSAAAGAVDETGSSDAGDHRTWVMLHGWMASQLELVDVWHPRALSAPAAGQELVVALRRALEA
jgi:hypothetical protein